MCSAVGGVFWSHKIILAAVSPFLKTLLLGSEDDGSVLTLHLPQVAAAHIRLVLDYVYTGAMYLRADQGRDCVDLSFTHRFPHVTAGTSIMAPHNGIIS